MRDSNQGTAAAAIDFEAVVGAVVAAVAFSLKECVLTLDSILKM